MKKYQDFELLPSPPFKFVIWFSIIGMFIVKVMIPDFHNSVITDIMAGAIHFSCYNCDNT